MLFLSKQRTEIGCSGNNCKHREFDTDRKRTIAIILLYNRDQVYLNQSVPVGMQEDATESGVKGPCTE